MPKESAKNSERPLALWLTEAYHPIALVRPPSWSAFVVAALLGLVVSGCATSGRLTTGLLALRGVDQHLVLSQADLDLGLTGRAEVMAMLDRLVDARVRVAGPEVSGVVTVRSFEILEAPDGMIPFVGVVVVDQSGTRLDEESSGTPIYLRGDDLRSLRRHHGARIWVTGSVVGGQTILIAHWGLIAPPSDP